MRAFIVFAFQRVKIQRLIISNMVPCKQYLSISTYLGTKGKHKFATREKMAELSPNLNRYCIGTT